MSQAGVLPADKATQFGVQLRQQKGALFRDDAMYQLEDLNPDEISGVASRQNTIISRRVSITEEVLQILDDHEASLANPLA
jgi:hypothetical protein